MRRNLPLDEVVAHRIYDVVVENVPLTEHVNEHLGMDQWRYNFVRYATDGEWTEYRIGGPLGFGGKLRNNGRRWYVDCYPEDSTPEREAAIKRTNEALDKLWQAHYGEVPQRW